MKGWRTSLLIVVALLTAAWCVALPFYWAHGLSMSFGMPYSTALYVFLPHFILAAVVACCLLLAGFRKRLAVIGFVFAAVLAPVLTAGTNNPASDAWFVSTLLLLLLAWRYRAYLAVQA
jgi:hypothetical protein